jgi:predicted enzyme related to lactoylglutathione lyase
MTPTPMAVVHLELHTGDQVGASAFYARLLSWRPNLIRVASGSYLGLELGGTLGGGIVIEPWSVSGGYPNYMQADEPLERVRAALGRDFARLQTLKRRYDPNNVLRRNQNIPPE